MRTRYVLLLVLQLVGLPVLLMPSASPARAFQVSIHDEILEAALKDVANEAARAKTEGHLLLGTGAAGVDLDQVSAEKHFDSVKDPAELCTMWNAGFKPALINAVQNALGAAYWQSNGAYGLLGYNDAALDHFGRAAHAIQDFYSHSNWVELRQNATTDLPLMTAPIVGADCDATAFPKDLQTGYASLGYFLTFGTWCNPFSGPPEGYLYCHDTLAKDEPGGGHGKAYPTGDSPTRPGEQTYHEMAKHLAIQATRELWQLFHDNVVFQIERDRRFEGYDAECLFRGIARLGEETSTCARCPAPGSTGSVIPDRVALRQPLFYAAPVVELIDRPAPLLSAQPAACPATSTAGTYSTTSGLSGEILDTVASSLQSRWGFRGEPVTLTRGELKVEVDADGRLISGAIVLEGSKAGGETARFEGTADPGSTGSAFFRGPLRACGGPLGCLEVEGRLSLDFITQASGEWYVCVQVNDRCRATPQGILRHAHGTGGTGPEHPPLEPELGPSWSGTFSTSRGTLELVVTGFSATGSFRQSATAVTAAASPLVERQVAANDAAQTVAGTIEARVFGNRLRGVWYDGASLADSGVSGDIDFYLAEDGAGFDGRWSNAADGIWRTDWTGTRVAVSPPLSAAMPPVERQVLTLRGDTGPAALGCIPCDGQARFMGPGRLGTALGLGVGNQGEASVAVAQPAGTLRNLRVQVSAADGGIWSFNVWVNGAPTPLVCTVHGRANPGQTSCDSGATAIAIGAGDRVSLGVGNPGDPFTRGNFTVEWSLELEVTP